MPSLSFDPVAHAYDATRGYPPGVAEQIASAIVNTVNATSQTTFLEVGIGTGRIAFPLASLGHNYTGVDISEKMVEQLETKLIEQSWQEYNQPWGNLPDENAGRGDPLWSPGHVVRRFKQVEQHASMRLVMSDMTKLPFYDASFDVVIAVHVFHLVDGWQRALAEALRVLRPGGLFLHCWDEFVHANAWPVGETWVTFVRELGGDARRPGAANRNEVTQWLRKQGLQPEEMRTTRWEITSTPREAVEQVTKRLWSSTWDVPDDIFGDSVERLQYWANDYFGDTMDTLYHAERRFVICKTQVRPDLAPGYLQGAPLP